MRGNAKHTMPPHYFMPKNASAKPHSGAPPTR